ncbi:hypothetical protein [Lysinibacillus telephonicus]|uniref:Uncharacterized protein n=1 Tax=Lysinibacillus telephonicus TaxID=1714840 RepID=A0A431UT74_9BACI|nr:hypothetical protein [Lysinibacillus telephonicus]RTQ92740.1 hypothetical protein EKG35_11275 [Lysinibacillus telephonicus]
MILKIYRIIHLVWTGIFAFYISIPILEQGSMERKFIDEALFIVLWIIGVFLLFNKKLAKYGFLLTILPFIFAIFIYIF